MRPVVFQGAGLNSIASTSVKMDVFAPMPSANVKHDHQRPGRAVDQLTDGVPEILPRCVPVLRSPTMSRALFTKPELIAEAAPRLARGLASGETAPAVGGRAHLDVQPHFVMEIVAGAASE